MHILMIIILRLYRKENKQTLKTQSYKVYVGFFPQTQSSITKRRNSWVNRKNYELRKEKSKWDFLKQHFWAKSAVLEEHGTCHCLQDKGNMRCQPVKITRCNVFSSENRISGPGKRKTQVFTFRSQANLRYFQERTDNAQNKRRIQK